MKELTGYFLKKDILFKKIDEISVKDLNSRKKIKVYCATSVKKEYYSIFIIDAKSRFVKKTYEELESLFENLVFFKNHNFKKKILLISSPICSKTKKLLEDNKWSVNIDFM